MKYEIELPDDFEYKLVAFGGTQENKLSLIQYYPGSTTLDTQYLINVVTANLCEKYYTMGITKEECTNEILNNVYRTITAVYDTDTNFTNKEATDNFVRINQKQENQKTEGTK